MLVSIAVAFKFENKFNLPLADNKYKIISREFLARWLEGVKKTHDHNCVKLRSNSGRQSYQSLNGFDIQILALSKFEVDYCSLLIAN